jgi:hypothetical protein
MIDRCPASDARTRTPMPLLANVVMKLRRLEWLVAPFMPTCRYRPFSVWHSTLAVNPERFCVMNNGRLGSLIATGDCLQIKNIDTECFNYQLVQ